MNTTTQSKTFPVTRTDAEWRRLLNPEQYAVMRGHQDSVVSVAFSPSGHFLATGSWDGRVEGINDLRAQYTLGFTPEPHSDPRIFHKLHVKVEAPGQGRLRVRTRAGFLTPADTPPQEERR